MIKKLILIGLLLSGISVCAAEIPVTITPVNKISTSNNSLHEGDLLEFRDVDTNRIIQGTLREITDNGLAGIQATIFINNFRYKDTGENLSGELFIKGGEHEKYQEVSNIIGASMWVRGGEVILEPDKTRITVFLNKGTSTKEIPVNIRPSEKISTCHDELESGDKIRFYVTKDVYKNNKLFIKKGAPIVGIIDYISNNGWSYDNAQIDIQEFRVKDISGNIIQFTSPVSINGFEILKIKGNRKAQFFNYCGILFRGKEIEIIPEVDDFQLNVWIK